MPKIGDTDLHQRGSIYTLAQNGTSTFQKQTIQLTGFGSEIGDLKALKGRAKRKLVSQKMSLALVEIAEKEGSNTFSFWNTYHCQNTFISSKGRYYTKYCKNRFCTVCCSIRKATIINKYLPIIKQWTDPHFVTITAKSVKLGSLGKRLRDLNRGFRKINSKQRKRHQRGKGIKLIGIKSLECNFNPKKKTYNPHLHLIVATKEMADIIISEWLRICTPKFARPIAQDSRKVKSKEGALIEVVKYGSKIISDPDDDKNKQNRTSSQINAKALFNIYFAMKGLRIFERFGFNLPKQPFKRMSQFTSEYEEWYFDMTSFDWLNAQTGLKLSGFTPSCTLIELLENHIEKEAC